MTVTPTGGNPITRASMITIALCVLVFPFSVKISVLLLILHYLVSFKSSRVIQKPWKSLSMLALASILFYLHHLISLSYTTNLQAGLRDLETKTTFLVFPLLGMILPRTDGEQFFFRKAWVASFAIASVYFLTRATLRFESEGHSGVFFYDEFSFLMHPTYFTMMLSIAIIFHLHNWKLSPQTASGFNNYFLFGILVLAAGLCSSRGGMMVLLISLMVYFFINKSAYNRSSILTLVTISAVIVTAVMLTSSRYNVVLKEAMNTGHAADNEVDHTPMAHRMLLWDTAFKVALQHPLGTGSGDVVDELVKEYRHINYEKAVAVHYNPHNQYLQTAIGLGITGLILLILIICMPILFMVRYKNWMLAGLISLIIALNALFESVFEVQKGVLMFGYMMVFVMLPLQTTRKE